jgi:hypothetical protein
MMRKRNAFGILTVLVMGMVLMSGCTNTGSSGTVPVASPTQQIVTGTELATSSPTPVPPRYKVGDIVWRNESNYDTELHKSRGMIIIRVSAQSYTYQYVSKDDGDTLWSQFYPNEEIDTTASFEQSYPRKVDHVLSVTSQYPSRAAFEDALSSEPCCSASSGTSGSQNFSGSPDECT